jgi:hypothetical protein
MIGNIDCVASAHNRGIFWNKLKIFIGQVFNRKLWAVIFPETLFHIVLAARGTAHIRTFSVPHIPAYPSGCLSCSFCILHEAEHRKPPPTTRAVTDLRRDG